MPIVTRLRSGAGKRRNYRSLAGMKTRKPRLAKPAAKAVAAIAKRVVNRNEETKHVGVNAVNAAFNSSISAASECYPVIPTVAEGDNGCTRDGNRIKPKYLLVRGHLQYDEGAQGNFFPPSTVRIMILSQKNIKVGSDVSNRADVTHLLKDNIGTDVARAYTGTMFDNLAPINTDLFKVHMDRKFRMLPQLYTGLGNSSDTNTKTLSGTQKTYYFTKKIKCPASLYFDDGNGNWPNNFAPFVCMGGVCDDNAGAFSVTTPYRLTVQSVLYFTDA